jgi:hypothetical protein
MRFSTWKGFRKTFETGVGNDIETMWNEPSDGRDERIKLPDSIAPTTEDHNIIYVDPHADGQFSAPNPLSPKQWRKDPKASTGSPDDAAASGASPDIYPRLVSRVVSSARGNINLLNMKQPPQWQQADRPLGIFSGKPMPDYPLPPSIWDLSDNSDASGNSAGNWFTSPAGGSRDRSSSPMPEPQKSQGSSPSTLLDYIQYLNRLDSNKWQAPGSDPGRPGASFALSNHPNPLGNGLANWIVALSGIDPQNPTQPAPQAGGLLGLLTGKR